MRTKLKRDENVVLLIRQHWFVLALPATITLLGMATGIAVAIFWTPYGLLLPFALALFMWYKIVQWRNNIWVVTNLRVVDEYGLFSHHSKESPLEKINNVTYNQSVWGRVFGYGDVQIQTAAEIGSTTYFMVERPKVLKDTITEMQEEYKRSQILSQAQELAKAISGNQQKRERVDIPAEIEKLFELKQKGIITEQEFNDRKRKILDL